MGQSKWGDSAGKNKSVNCDIDHLTSIYYPRGLHFCWAGGHSQDFRLVTPPVSQEARMLGWQTMLLATTAESRPSAGTPLRQALQKALMWLIMMPVWQTVQAGLLGTDSSLCSLPSHQAVCPGTASNLPSHGWQAGQMACGGKWVKNFTLVGNSLLTFFSRTGSLHKLNASNVSSGTIWEGKVEASCAEPQTGERASGPRTLPLAPLQWRLRVPQSGCTSAHCFFLPWFPSWFDMWWLPLPRSSSAPLAWPDHSGAFSKCWAPHFVSWDAR